MNFFTHFGTYLLMLKGMFTKPENWRMYWKEFMHQCVEIGIGALPIVVIISIFLGAVTTVQTAYQLVSPLVPSSTIAQIVRDSMILELSPTVLSIVLAGVVGSKIASELGNMRISEQIDALEIMGINSKSYLILPKILAALLNLNLYNINFSMYKAYTFAFILSSVPAYFGYNVKGGSLEIGRASTSAVVVSCILILVADYALAAILL